MELEILKYEFDDTGLSRHNLAQGEEHEVHESTKFILLRGGCFYRAGLEIKLMDTNETLKEFTDFRLGNFYQKATTEVGQAIYGSVFFERPIQGKLAITVQYIGGKYSVDTIGIAELLQAVGSRGDKVLWDDIIKPENGVKASLHIHNTQTDLKGTEQVVDALLKIGDIVMTKIQMLGETSGGYSAEELERRLDNSVIHQTSDYTVNLDWFDSRTLVFTGHSVATTALVPTGNTKRQGMSFYSLVAGSKIKFSNPDDTPVYGVDLVNGEIVMEPRTVYRLDSIGNDEYLVRKYS